MANGNEGTHYHLSIQTTIMHHYTSCLHQLIYLNIFSQQCHLFQGFMQSSLKLSLQHFKWVSFSIDESGRNVKKMSHFLQPTFFK